MSLRFGNDLGGLGMGTLQFLLILGRQLMGLLLLVFRVFQVVFDLRRAAFHHFGDGLKEETLQQQEEHQKIYNGPNKVPIQIQ